MKINLFIGTSPNSEDRDIEMVYEYSLKKNTQHELNITWMRLHHDSSNFWGGWNTKKWFTPFSGFRWAIPEYCNYEGRAIYTDVDMINLCDIGELFSLDMEGKVIAARKGIRWNYEFCVMVIDCKKAKDYVWGLKKLKKNKNSHNIHKDIFNTSDLVKEIDPSWNCLDGEEKQISEIKQLHFTNMQTQPWKPSWYRGETLDHPRIDIIDLYNNLKAEALTKGYAPREIPLERLNYQIQL